MLIRIATCESMPVMYTMLSKEQDFLSRARSIGLQIIYLFSRTRHQNYFIRPPGASRPTWTSRWFRWL